MPVKRRNPRRRVISVAVSEADKEFVEQEAQISNQSVSQYLRPGLILSICMHYLGITVDEAVARLLNEEAAFEEFVGYLARNEIRASELARYYAARKRREEVETKD